MNKEKLLEVLFDEWSENHDSSCEYDNACNILSPKDYDGFVTDSVNAESRLAFNAGFQTAVALLTGGVK